jgi:hypothetical protein
MVSISGEMPSMMDSICCLGRFSSSIGWGRSVDLGAIRGTAFDLSVSARSVDLGELQQFVAAPPI